MGRIRSTLEKIILIGALLIPIANETKAQEDGGPFKGPGNVYTGQIHECQEGTTIYKKWIDKDGDRYFDWGEFLEDNQSEYKRGGMLYLLIHLPKNKNPGGITRVILNGPRGAKVERNSQLVGGADDWTWIGVDSEKMYDAIDGGPGQYKVDFMVNDQLFQQRWFNLIDDGSSVRPFNCNFLNEEKGLLKTRAVGLNKPTYKKNEVVTFGAEFRHHTGEKARVELLSPKGEKIHSFEHDIKEYYWYIWSGRFSCEELLKRYGEGTYSASIYLNDKYFKSADINISE